MSNAISHSKYNWIHEVVTVGFEDLAQSQGETSWHKSILWPMAPEDVPGEIQVHFNEATDVGGSSASCTISVGTEEDPDFWISGADWNSATAGTNASLVAGRLFEWPAAGPPNTGGGALVGESGQRNVILTIELSASDALVKPTTGKLRFRVVPYNERPTSYEFPSVNVN